MSSYALPDAAVDSLELGGRKRPDGAPNVIGAAAAVVTLNDLPPLLRFAVKYNVTSSCGNRAAYVVASLLLASFPFLLFAGATGNLPIGVVFCVVGTLSNISALTQPDFAKHKRLLAFLHSRADEVTKAVKGMFIGSIIFFCGLLMPMTFVFLATPNIIDTHMLGEDTYAIVVALTVCVYVGAIGTNVMGALGMVFEQVQLEWCARIEVYLQQVREHLLKVSEGANAEDVIAGLASVQEENEAWAREMNQSFSKANGLMVPLSLIWSFLPLAMIAVPSAEETRLAQVVTLSVLAAFFQLIFATSLTGVTKVNLTWERGTARLLNDARIQLLRLNTVGAHGTFDRWLQNHELNAARAGGVKVTLSLLRSSVGAVGSLFILTTYLVLRENLSGLLE